MKKGKQIIINQISYQLIETIGNGGSATVWKALFNEKEYAIKIINSGETNKIERFKNEIEFCKTSNNENIIKIIADGKHNGKPCYVMPLYPQTFRDLINKEKNAIKLITLILELCKALKYIHGKDVFHRDIKPENILINGDSLVLADFGIAHFKDFKLTKKADLLANRDYASPEQREKGRADRIEKHADIFALGLIINECFTKQNPSGSDFKLIADSHPLYASLDDLVANMIRQNPIDRPNIYTVITEIKYIHNKIKKNIEDIANNLKERTQFPKMKESVLKTVIQRASEDILFGKMLFTSKSVEELSKYNHNWHMKIGYMVDDFLFNLYMQEKIHALCKAKFEYESRRHGRKSWYESLDLENDSNHKILYEQINDILLRYALKEKGESLFDLSGQILKYFSSCADYHCQEILGSIKQEEKFAQEYLKDTPIIAIVQTLKDGIIHNIESLLKGIDGLGGQYDFDFIKHISINPERIMSYHYNEDDSNLIDGHYQKQEIQIQKILTNFQKEWKITYNRINEEKFSIKFETYNQFEKFRKFAFELSKPHYVFEGDVIGIFRKPNYVGDMVELKLGTAFEISNTVAKIIGQRKIYE
ncbi:MAG: serine/threonine protein kinase [Brumimicrobium sp.]|nr:serine/threonine protein kinase [Brumimicrobium sp.]